MAETQASSGPHAGAEIARAYDWLRSNAVVTAAVLLIGASLWWKSALLAHSYFRLDDFFFLERATSSGLTWKYLMWVDAGHLTPAGYAIAWILVRISPVDWTLTSAATIVMLAVACFALLRLLRTLFGDHPGILILLTVYLLSPLSFSGFAWWSVTLEMLPLQIAIFFAVTAHVLYLRTGRFRHAVACAAWLFVAMASSLRGAAVPLLLLALTSAFFVQGPWPRAVLATLRDRWRAWAMYAVVMAGYVALYAVQLSTSSVAPGRPGAFSSVFAFAVTLIKDTFIPGALGGPWRWIGVGVSAGGNPPAELAVISWLVAAAVVAVSLLYNSKAWRAWVILAGWLVVVDIVPVVLGRASFLPGVLLGLVTRYVWDALGVLALILGLAFLPLAGERRAGDTREAQGFAHRRLPFGRPLRTAAACVFTAFVIGSAWSFYSYPTDPNAAAGSSYVATARIALSEAPAGTVIVNDPIPADVMGGVFFGSMGEASGLLTPLITGTPRGRPRFIERPNGTYDHLMELDGWGRLVPSVVSGTASRTLPSGKICWPVHNGTMNIQLRTSAVNPVILRLGYLSGSSGQMWVEFGGQSQLYNFQNGLNAAFLPAQGTGRTIVIQAVSGSLPCISDAEAGVLLPSGVGPAIPQYAVNG